MQSQKVPFDKQIFVCTNDRQGTGQSCGDQQGEAVFRQLRGVAKDRGLHPRIRVAQAKCLGKCSEGVNVMVYPDGTWHSGVTVGDVQALADQYLSPEKND
jgi:(2Fe-2S) ferredoxin